MTRHDEILINKFGQGLVDNLSVLEIFKSSAKHKFLHDLLFMVLQSKPVVADIEPAIKGSRLKPTLTPCVLLRKGVAQHNLRKIIELPESEAEKSFKLLLSLFKISYHRRFELEKNDPHKWWYWDFSSEENVRKAIEANTLG